MHHNLWLLVGCHELGLLVIRLGEQARMRCLMGREKHGRVRVSGWVEQSLWSGLWHVGERIRSSCSCQGIVHE